MSRIKECFTSRWGEDGVIMEADFSQLEVIGLAIVSGDSVLKNDILDGIDFHAQTACWLYGFDYHDFMKHFKAGDKRYKDMRQSAKAPNFLNQYGGGAWLMSKNTGIDQSKCQAFIDAYYEKYSGVKAFQDAVMDEVKMNRTPSTKTGPNGTPLGLGWYTSVTGRKYVFYEYESDRKKKWGPNKGQPQEPSFSPTEMKNYPVQGFATADIVPEILGRLYRFLRTNYDEEARLVGTVHDSIVLDVKEEYAPEVADFVKSVMEYAGRWMEDRYGLEIDMPLKADVEYAESWADCK